MKRAFFIITFFLALAAFILVQALTPLKFGANASENLPTLNISAKSAFLVEANTGTVLYKENENSKLPMASMTKMMTLKIVFDEIEAGRLFENEKISISDNAAKQIGSQAFLDAGQQYSISDLLKTTIVASANDSAMALAEKVSGDETAFVDLMNKKASAIGLLNTHFNNPTGLPAADHYSTARDMAKLCSHVVTNSLYKKYSKIYLDELVHPSGRKTQLVNTNKSLKSYVGFEGGKTGHTQEAGYCMAAVAKRGEMTLVAVVMGEPSSKNRTIDIVSLFDFGFNNFKTKQIVSNEKPIEKIGVNNGQKSEICVFCKDSFIVFMNKNDKFEYEIKKSYIDLNAPIEKGKEIGRLQIVSGGDIVFETSLVAGEESRHIGLWKIYRSLIERF